MGAIKLYTDFQLLEEKSLSVNTFPLIDCLIKNSKLESNSDFEFVTNPEHCQLFVFPIAVDHMAFLGRKKDVVNFIKSAKSLNKKVLIFSSGDIGLTLKFKNVICVRLSGFDSKLTNDTFIMPPFIEDPYTKIDKEFRTLQKSKQPSIGFVGHANGGVIKFIKEYAIFIKLNIKRIWSNKYVDFQSFYPSGFLRHKYLKRLEKDQNLNTDFIYRSKYRAGAKTKADLEKTTSEFYENMYNNPYTFCLRGLGNFSVRFYETLAMGRIPVLLDTDCKLPFSEVIDWKKHCLIINKSDISKFGNYLNDFHNSFDAEAFKQIQESNRLLWETYFTKYNFFLKLKQIILKDIK